MTRNAMLALTAGGVLAIAAGGWAAAGAILPAPPVATPDGRVLQVRYEVRRMPVYVPPAPTEATRLEVMGAQPPTLIEDGVLSAQAGEALRALQAEDAARTAAALAAIRAEDARIDRDTASALATERDASASTSSQSA